MWDAFEAVVLPKTAGRKVRLARWYFRITWNYWTAVARVFVAGRRREPFLAAYGPLSLIGLLAMWAVGLVTGFALLYWSQQALVSSLPGDRLFFDYLYFSGTTFFTLGMGDVVPHDPAGRLLTVVEAGMGLMFLTMILAYLPVLYGSFSRREVRLTILDAWAGSPPAAAEILCRLGRSGNLSKVDEFLKHWDYWCAEVMESHLSHEAVAYFRSQHERQSWVSALTTLLDLSALIKVGIDGVPTWRAHLTFAIARRTAVALTQALNARPVRSTDRLPPDELAAMRRELEDAGLTLNGSLDAQRELVELRRSYEPYVLGLSSRLMLPVPPWRHAGRP